MNTLDRTSSMSLQEVIDDLSNQLDEIDLFLRRPPLNTPPVHSVRPDDLDPNGVADSDNQLILRNALKQSHSAGLARALEEISEKTMADHKSKVWKHVQEPHILVMMNIITTMYHGMVEALIDGNLSSRMYSDIDFAMAIDAHHSLVKLPGNYVQQIGRRPVVKEQSAMGTFGRKVDYPGRWLAIEQVPEFYDSLLKYLSDPVFAKRVDEQEPSGYKVRSASSYLTGYRRFTRTKAGKPKIEAFADAIEPIAQRARNMIAKYASKNDPQLKERLETPLAWGPLEIGYGVDLAARADSHTDFKKSNFLFTFIQSLLAEVFEGKKYFQIYRRTTNLLPRPYITPTDTVPFQDANTTDVGITLLAQSHWFAGGFNPDFGAGGGVSKSKLAEQQQLLLRSYEEIYGPASTFQANLRRGESAIDEYERRENQRESEVVLKREITQKRLEMTDPYDDARRKLWLLGEVAKSVDTKEQLALLRPTVAAASRRTDGRTSSRSRSSSGPSAGSSDRMTGVEQSVAGGTGSPVPGQIAGQPTSQLASRPATPSQGNDPNSPTTPATQFIQTPSARSSSATPLGQVLVPQSSPTAGPSASTMRPPSATQVTAIAPSSRASPVVVPAPKKRLTRKNRSAARSHLPPIRPP